MWYQGKCIKRCGLSPNSLRLVASNGSCLCATGYIWKDEFLQCSINCGVIANAMNKIPYDPNNCKCATNFIWDSVQKICKANCSALPHTISKGAAPNGMCNCVYGYIPTNLSTCRSDCQFVCRIDCSLYQYATRQFATYDGCYC